MKYKGIRLAYFDWILSGFVVVVELVLVNQSFKLNNTIVWSFLINAGKKNLTSAKLIVPHGMREMISESTMPW